MAFNQPASSTAVDPLGPDTSSGVQSKEDVTDDNLLDQLALCENTARDINGGFNPILFNPILGSLKHVLRHPAMLISKH